LINELVATGLATASTECEERGDKTIEIVRVKMTEAGLNTVRPLSSRAGKPFVKAANQLRILYDPSRNHLSAPVDRTASRV
jgi:hypothetical protein